MAGTKAGGLKAAATNKKRFGKNWYAEIGRKGGLTSSKAPTLSLEERRREIAELLKNEEVKRLLEFYGVID